MTGSSDDQYAGDSQIRESDRAQLERRLEAAEAARDRYEFMLDAIGEAVIVTDINGEVCYWNRRAEALYGWSAAEAMGRNILELTPAEETVDQAADIMAALREGREWAGEITVRRKDGTTFPAHVTDAPLVDAAGELVGVVGISRDLTNEKALEAQLRQAHKLEAIGRLAGGIAHDFNNMLTAITANAHFLLPELTDPGLRDSLEEIALAGRRAADLTRQLLAFSRQQVLKVRPVSLARVVCDMKEMLRRLLREDIELSVVAAPETGTVMADASQLTQVVMNLVLNARDAMPAGGRLTLAVDNVDVEAPRAARLGLPAGSYVHLIVSDTGNGIDPETMNNLFEPFFTTKEAGKGTGLGLSTVYGIVTQCGGHIRVESRPNHGTMFRIFFPRIDAVESPEQRADDPRVDASANGETVLICEDQAEVRKVVRQLLEREGYEVLEAASGSAAVALMEKLATPPDVVLSDVVMPEMGGPELIAVVRERWPDVKIMLMSGYARPELFEGGDGLEDTMFLQKPLEVVDLAKKLRELLDE